MIRRSNLVLVVIGSGVLALVSGSDTFSQTSEQDQPVPPATAHGESADGASPETRRLSEQPGAHPSTVAVRQGRYSQMLWIGV